MELLCILGVTSLNSPQKMFFYSISIKHNCFNLKFVYINVSFYLLIYPNLS